MEVNAQLTVQAITYTGLKKNKQVYLDELIDLQKGQLFEQEKIDNAVQNLKNSTGIGYATYSLDTVQNGVNINFIIEEVATLLPIINFGGIKDNIWFQLGFGDTNWKGKGRTLSAYYQNNDKRHSGVIYFINPRFKNSHWGFSTSLTSWASREPLFFREGVVSYDYDNNSIMLSAIRHLGQRQNFEFGGNFFVEKYTKSENQPNAANIGPQSLTQSKLLSKFEFKSNKVDYHFFYLSGRSWRTTLQNVYNTDDETLFHSLQFQGRQFYTMGEKSNLAFRLRLAISTNVDSPFAPYVADSHVNLRGVGNRVDRGTAQVVFNAEYRYSLMDKPVWAIQSVVFADMGTWRKPGGDLTEIFNQDMFREFVGGGFRVINKKVHNAVFRVDYGVDVFNRDQRGFVIGLGQYF